MLDRRTYLKTMGRIGLSTLLPNTLGHAEDQLIVEQQRGDPNLESETLRINKSSATRAMYAKAVFEPRKPGFGDALIKTAQQFLGFSRTTTPDRIAELLALYDLPLKNG